MPWCLLKIQPWKQNAYDISSTFLSPNTYMNDQSFIAVYVVASWKGDYLYLKML